jgi:hypothetical protein
LIQNASLGQPDQAWEAYLDQGWDKAAVQALVGNIPQLAPQVGFALCGISLSSVQNSLGSKVSARHQRRKMLRVLGLFYGFALGQPDQAWEAYLDQSWDKAAVQALVGNIPQLAPQVGL